MYDLIVIGGGPAGLTAMIYAIRKHLNTLLVTQDLGGKTNFHLELPDVPDYRVIRGVEIVNRFKSELEYLDFAWEHEQVTRVSAQEDFFVVHTQTGEELQARAVIIATGARPQRLEIPGEEEFLGKGIAYSAMSYAPLMIAKTVAVIGQGELALRSAAELATVAKHVYLVGPEAAILDSTLGQKLRYTTHVQLFEGFLLQQVLGNDFAERIQISQGIETKELAVDCIFIEKQLIPNSEMVRGLLPLDEQDRIKIDCRTHTSIPGIYAAGDVTSLYAEQVLIAVGEGAKAALSAYDYLLPKL